MTALAGLSALAEPLLNRRLYPTGAMLLQPLLAASLPGIDPLGDHDLSLFFLPPSPLLPSPPPLSCLDTLITICPTFLSAFGSIDCLRVFFLLFWPTDWFKTQLTLKWLQSVFYNVPFVDARDTSASSVAKSPLQLPDDGTEGCCLFLFFPLVCFLCFVFVLFVTGR